MCGRMGALSAPELKADVSFLVVGSACNCREYTVHSCTCRYNVYAAVYG